METTARNRTIGGIVIGAIILILLLVLFSCTVSGDPKGSPTNDPTPGESSSLPSDPDTIEPDEDPSESESDEPEEIDGDDIVPAANTGVTFIPAGNVPSGSTPTCDLDPSACEPNRPPGAGVDICEIRPDLTQCQEPETPTTPPTDPSDPTDPTDPTDPICELFPDLPICDDNGPGPGNPDPEDNTAPEPVNLFGCEVLTNTSAKVDWSKAQDKSGISHYTVTSRPSAGNANETEETSATYRGLEAGETYTFSVTATDKAKNESRPSNEVDCVMDVTAPQVPEDLTVEAGDPSDSTLEVSWSESEDNTDGVGDVSYNLYRDGQLVGPVNGTSYEDTDLKAGTEYTYSVQAVDGAGNESARSAGVSGTTTKIAPTVPTGLRASGEGVLGFELAWNQSTDEDKVTPDAEIDYRVSVNGGLCFGGTANDATTFSVTCVLLWDTTEVRVTAIDGDGNESAPSRPLTVRSSGERPEGPEGAGAGNPGLRSSTPGEDKSDAPADDKPGLPEAPVEAPSDKPTDEKSPLLPGLGDILPGGEDTAEAPAEKPAEPEAEPTESESPAARPTTEEPVAEPTEKAAEEAPAEKDEDGLLKNIGDALSSAVAAVF